MNYEKLQKHIYLFCEKVVNHRASVTDDKSNISDFFCADVVGNKRFAQNYAGYPRSEIAEINAQTNLQTQMSMLSMLEDYSTGKNENAGLSDAAIMMSHKSKYMQTPSEMTNYLEGLCRERENVRFAQQQAAAAQAAKAAAKAKKSDVKVIENEPE